MEIAGPVFSLVTGFITAGKQRDAYDAAAEQQRNMAERNAQRIEAETREETRQQREAQRQEQARATAAAAASGALVGSKSHRDYGQGLWDARQKEINWTIKSGRSRAEIERAGGQYAAATSEAQGDAAWWGTMSTAVSNATSFL